MYRALNILDNISLSLKRVEVLNNSLIKCTKVNNRTFFTYNLTILIYYYLLYYKHRTPKIHTLYRLAYFTIVVELIKELIY
jgi:hypothetical protein